MLFSTPILQKLLKKIEILWKSDQEAISATVYTVLKKNLVQYGYHILYDRVICDIDDKVWNNFGKSVYSFPVHSK